MSLNLSPITWHQTLKYLNEKGCNVTATILPLKDGNFCVSVKDDDNIVRGVIAMIADNNECKLLHMHTDGTPLAGSVLYGAAWRAAKALGYKQITI